jgi:hypothetical protein
VQHRDLSASKTGFFTECRRDSKYLYLSCFSYLASVFQIHQVPSVVTLLGIGGVNAAHIYLSIKESSICHHGTQPEGRAVVCQSVPCSGLEHASSQNNSAHVQWGGRRLYVPGDSLFPSYDGLRFA